MVDGTVVVELEVVLLSGVDDVVVELVLVVDEVEVLLVLVLELLVVLVGDGRAAHGFGLQVPGPMSTPPVLRHARLVFTRHSGAPLAPARQHWIRWWPRCGRGVRSAPGAQQSLECGQPEEDGRNEERPGRGGHDSLLCWVANGAVPPLVYTSNRELGRGGPKPPYRGAPGIRGGELPTVRRGRVPGHPNAPLVQYNTPR